ncbi:MAG: hypothetical protein K8E24_007540 [Methanobacterium paludis]|nr:hypothetical protein [Methanobacterium paludis]
MARNIINMILWHPEMDIEGTKITYIHRGIQGNLKTIDGNSIGKLEGGFLILKEGRLLNLQSHIKKEYKRVDTEHRKYLGLCNQTKERRCRLGRELLSLKMLVYREYKLRLI